LSFAFPGVRQRALTLRPNSLIIESGTHRRPSKTSAMVRVQIQPLDVLERSENDRQLQLCVPSVSINGPSYRLKGRLDVTKPPSP
jgi:hypothetical protein